MVKINGNMKHETYTYYVYFYLAEGVWIIDDNNEPLDDFWFYNFSTDNTPPSTGWSELNGTGNPSVNSTSLPVELTTFTSVPNGNMVKLCWQTATEVNNYGFEIERGNRQKTAGNSAWVKVGFVQGNGNSNSSKEYSFVDKSVSNGKYLYRLKQIDNDGKYEYSKEIEVSVNNLPTEFALGQNYPNPFNPNTSIKYSVPYESSVKLVVFNTLGEIVKELVSEVKATGNYEVNFNASHLSSGIYFYALTAQPLNGGENFRSVKKLVLVK